MKINNSFPARLLEKTHHQAENLLLALDSAKDRRAAQASLPRRIANAWTQPSDLGVSQHEFLDGACVNCLYLPEIRQRNEDDIIAEALGVPERLMEVRELLYRRDGAPRGSPGSDRRGKRVTAGQASYV